MRKLFRKRNLLLAVLIGIGIWLSTRTSDETVPPDSASGDRPTASHRTAEPSPEEHKTDFQSDEEPSANTETVPDDSPYNLKWCWHKSNRPFIGECRPGLGKEGGEVADDVPCDGEILPSPETCDGLDYDCDGHAGEPLPTGSWLVCRGVARNNDETENHFFLVTDDCRPVNTAQRFGYISEFRAGVAIAQMYEKIDTPLGRLRRIARRGVINREGRWLFAGWKFDDIGSFSDKGVAVATVGDKCYYVTADERELVPGARFNYCQGPYATDGIMLVTDGNSKYFIASDGKELFPGERYDETDGFFNNHSLACVAKGNSRYIIAKDNPDVFPNLRFDACYCTIENCVGTIGTDVYVIAPTDRTYVKTSLKGQQKP